MPRFDMPVNTNDQSIDRVLAAGLPVALVIHEGDRLNELTDTLLNVAKNDAGRVLVAKLDANANPTTAARYATAPRPALVTFKAGQPVTQVSAITPAKFRAHVDYLLDRGPEPVRDAPQPGPSAAGARGTASAPTKPVTVTDSSFERDVLRSDVPVLVDLWAPWCSPCRMIAPMLEKLAADFAGQVTIAKLNVDENPRTAGAYQVQGIPTLLMFKGGKVIDRIVGAQPEPVLRGRVQAALAR